MVETWPLRTWEPQAQTGQGRWAGGCREGHTKSWRLRELKTWLWSWQSLRVWGRRTDMSTLQLTLTPDPWPHCYLWPDSENSGCTQSGEEEKARKEGVAETIQEKEERTGKWLGSLRELGAHSQDLRTDVKTAWLPPPTSTLPSLKLFRKMKVAPRKWRKRKRKNKFKTSPLNLNSQ